MTPNPLPKPSRTRREASVKPGRSLRQTPRAPAHLDKPAAELWRRLFDTFDIRDPASIALLTSTCEAEMRGRRCREAIDRDGEVVRDRFNQLKGHALLPAERDARAAFLAGLKALNVDPAAV